MESQLSANNTASSRPTTPIPTTISSSVRSIFTSKPPSSLLADLAPVLLQSKYLASPHFTSSNSSSSARSPVASIGTSSNSLRAKLGWSGAPTGDARSLYVMQSVDELLSMDIPPSSEKATHDMVPLIRGFLATMPAAEVPRLERRKKRAGIGEAALGLNGVPLGLKERGDSARGLLANGSPKKIESGTAAERLRKRDKGKSRSNKKLEVDIPIEELILEDGEVEADLMNVAIRRVRCVFDPLRFASLCSIASSDTFSHDVQSVINSEISEVDAKILSLEAIRTGLQRNLLALRELELELDDERK
jgi:division protein 1